MRTPYPVATLLCWAFTVLHPGSAAAQAAGCDDGPRPPLAGAYQRADGSLLSLRPALAAGLWQLTDFASGLDHPLQPTGPLSFDWRPDRTTPTPPTLRVQLELDREGQPAALTLQAAGAAPVPARRLALRERTVRFRSGDIELHGRLTLPAAGDGPFRTVVHVHGSDPVPSVGREWLPHWLAAQGVATFVFDKRGTGCSQGRYVQHVGLLSDDVVAAVRWLQRQPDIDAARIGVAGFSQGGWVAPLAAQKERSIRFVAVAYGLAISMAEEDRLEAPMKLRALGLDEASVAEFERLNAALHSLARDGFRDWAPFEAALQRAQARPWFAQAAQQPSWLGVLMQMGLAQAKQVAPAMFRDFFEPFHDPVPTLEALDRPMLWLVAGQDIEAPPEATLAVLTRLQRMGRPLTVVVYPDADHGLQAFVVRDGQRVRTRYVDGYFKTLARWVKEQP